jgi:very-short-patch-repair endonuclease
MTLDHDLRMLAATQHALLTTDQASDLGFSRSALGHRVRNGTLVRLAPRVLCLAGVPLTDRLLLHAALLESGGLSAISHESAGAHWLYAGFRLLPPQITRHRDGTYPKMRLGRLHTTRVLPDSHLTDVNGLLLTTPARTLFDLAPRVSPERLERLLDRAWSRRLVTGALLHRMLIELEGSGRAGIVAMRALLEDRGCDYRPPESGIETRFRQLIREDGQPEMERQLDVGDETWLGRVDFVDREAKVIVEIDSELYHASISDRRSDEARRKALEAAGWIVLRITEFDVWHQPQRVQRAVRLARRRT